MKITLKAARVNAGLTQTEVAKKAGVSVQTVINWEKGKVIPNFATIRFLSDTYKVPTDYIFLPNNSTKS